MVVAVVELISSTPFPAMELLLAVVVAVQVEVMEDWHIMQALVDLAVRLGHLVLMV